MADTTSIARYFQGTTREAVLTPLSVANTGSELIGQSIQKAAGDLDEVVQRDERFWVQKQMADLDVRTQKTWTNLVENAKDGAAGFEQGYLSALDNDYAGMRGAAPSMRAGRLLDAALTQHRADQANRASGFATEEKYQFRVDTIKQDADNLAQELQRFPAVPSYQPQGYLTPPGLPGGSVPASAEGYFSSGINRPNDGFVLPNNLDTWQSKYYTPRDFADGENIQDRSGDIMVSKRMVSALDWVTDQFGYGKLGTNSGYRSPESNLKRAESGAHGPHTKGDSVDIQVRDLPQSEKNRLYSLFKAAGANSFGFGEGVLHVEFREGEPGKGRGGDHEWTYGNAAKYDLVSVAGPNASTSAAATGGQWGSANQYPYLGAVTMTAIGETGTTDLATASLNIARDSGGTSSYGALGLNSNGMLPTFVKEYGAKFGLTAAAGTPEFDAQWQQAVRNDPGGMVNAQLAFHEQHIARPAQSAMVTAGAVGVANDPRAMAFTSDLIVQYGPELARKHIAAGAGARDVSSYINAVGESTKRSLDADFATALAADPTRRTGLLNRIDQRARDATAMGTGAGTAITGNVPAWNGPVPDIDQVPGYNTRMARIDDMVDTMGGTPDQRRDLKRELRGNVVRNWLSSVAQVNPSAAMSALMSGRYDDALSASDSAALFGNTESSYRQMEAQIRQNQKELMETLRLEAQTKLADEVSSVAATGKSLGQLTESHMALLTPQEREQLSSARFQYDVTKEISTAKNSELPAILERLQPEGEGFAAEQVRYDFARKAIEEHLKAQAADPAAYVLQTFPQLSERWQAAVTSGDQAAIGANMRVMLEKQREIGIATPQLIPGKFASSIAEAFNNKDAGEQQRVDALMGTLAMAGDAEQRRLLFDQLVKAGVPAEAEGAVEAHLRGDDGAARRLFQAVIADPSKMPGKISEQTSAINEEIQAQLFDAGKVGDIYYGLTDGDASNFVAAQRDSSLLTKAVQLRLVQGDDLRTAVSKVAKDMFGDVEVISGYYGVNTQILLPKGTDPLPLLDGMAAVQGDIRKALSMPQTGTPDQQQAAKASGMEAVVGAAYGNYADMVLAEGYFRDAEDGYVFIDPFLGVAVKGADGKPLTFTDDQLITAGKTQRTTTDAAKSRAPSWDSLTEQERQALENNPTEGGMF